VGCFKCGAVRQIPIPFADPRRSYTHLFERFVLDLSREMTLLGVALHLCISWDTAKDIQKRYLNRRFSKPALRMVRRIAIDEFAIAKGHHYATVVLDLDTGAAVYVAKGKNASALGEFWKRLKAARARVRAVAIDMSPAYIGAVSKVGLAHNPIV
jgi:transposase